MLFNPGEFAVHNVNLTRLSGERLHVLAKDVFVIVDPTWIGLAPVDGHVFYVHAIPFYERPEVDRAYGTIVSPRVGGMLDPDRTVPPEQWTTDERNAVVAGTVIQGSDRFRYCLMAYWPRTFIIDSSDLVSLHNVDVFVEFGDLKTANEPDRDSEPGSEPHETKVPAGFEEGSPNEDSVRSSAEEVGIDRNNEE